MTTTTKPKTKVKALYDYQPQQSDELALKEGDIIEVTNKVVDGNPNSEWWEGKLNGKTGHFPKNYVKEL